MKRFALAAALLLLASAPARAQNLLSNPDFDMDTSGWGEGNFSITLQWDGADVDMDPSSGSARVTSAQADAASPSAKGSGMVQCVPVTPDAEYLLSGYSRIPSGQSRTALPDLTVVFFQVADCASDFIMQTNPESNPASGATDAWELLSTPIVAPANAVSVRVFARPRKQEAGGSVDVLFDAIELPEPGAAALGLAALGSLGALARRRTRAAR